MSQKKLHVKKGDTVVVISGAGKGHEGKILSVDPKKERVVVENHKVIKRHTKPSQSNPQGGIVEKSGSVHVSNVMVIDPETKKPTRLKKVALKDGKMVRATVKSGAILEK